jgi:hypothetical protein
MFSLANLIFMVCVMSDMPNIKLLKSNQTELKLPNLFT